jgi:hypothetical protein
MAEHNEFLQKMHAISTQLAAEYNWMNLPPQHSGTFWRACLFSPARAVGYRFNIIDCKSTKDCMNLVTHYGKVYENELHPIIGENLQSIQRLTGELYNTKSKDVEARKMLKDRIQALENENLSMNEVHALVRALRELLLHFEAETRCGCCLLA